MNQQEGYVDDVVKGFITWSIVWGLVAVLVGVFISFQLVMPQLNFPPYLTYGRLRPIHTNAGIFGWGIGSFMAFFSTSPSASPGPGSGAPGSPGSNSGSSTS